MKIFKNTKINEKEDFKELWDEKLFWQLTTVILLWFFIDQNIINIITSILFTISFIISCIRRIKYIRN